MKRLHIATDPVLIRTSLRRRTPLRPKTGLRPRRKTRKGRIPEAVLDALWQKVVKTRDHFTCQYYRTPIISRDCQAAHVLSRTYRGVRWDPDNGVTLSAKAHMLFHRNPILAGRWFAAHLGREKYDWLWAKAQAAGKIDRMAVKAHLRGLLKQLEGP